MIAFLKPLPKLPIRDHHELDPSLLSLLDHVRCSPAAWKGDNVIHLRELEHPPVAENSCWSAESIPLGWDDDLWNLTRDRPFTGKAICSLCPSMHETIYSEIVKRRKEQAAIAECTTAAYENDVHLKLPSI